MDTKLIKNIMNMFEGSGLSAIELSEETDGKKFSVKLEKNIGGAVSIVAPMPVNTVKHENLSQNAKVVDFNNVNEIKSPMVGIFYASPSPDSAAFVKKGDKIKKGDTLCIIEAMKLMNEVVSDRDGEVVEICAESGGLVEFGQVLFKIF